MYLINLKTGQSVSMQPKDHRGADQFFFDYRAPNDADGGTSLASHSFFENRGGHGRSAGNTEANDGDGSSISGSSSESGSESADIEELGHRNSTRKRLKFANGGMMQ